MPHFMLALILRSGATCLAIGFLACACLGDRSESKSADPIEPLAAAVSVQEVLPVYSVEWSPCGRRLVAIVNEARPGGNGLLFDMTDKMYDCQTLVVPSLLRRAMFLPGSDLIVGTADNGRVWRIDAAAETASMVSVGDLLEGNLRSIRPLPEGGMLILTCRELRRVDAEGALVWNLEVTDGVRNIVLTSDGRHIVLPTAYSGTLVIAADSGVIERSLATNRASAAAELTGLGVVIGDSDGLVAAWNLHTGDKIWERSTGQFGVTALSATQDGLIAAGDWKGRIVTLNRDGRELRRVEAHKGFVSTLSYSADGKLLASGGSKGALMVWDAQSMELVEKLK